MDTELDNNICWNSKKIPAWQSSHVSCRWTPQSATCLPKLPLLIHLKKHENKLEYINIQQQDLQKISSIKIMNSIWVIYKISITTEFHFINEPLSMYFRDEPLKCAQANLYMYLQRIRSFVTGKQICLRTFYDEINLEMSQEHLHQLAWTIENIWHLSKSPSHPHPTIQK